VLMAAWAAAVVLIDRWVVRQRAYGKARQGDRCATIRAAGNTAVCPSRPASFRPASPPVPPSLPPAPIGSTRSSRKGTPLEVTPGRWRS
jgi:hypothetical protein